MTKPDNDTVARMLGVSQAHEVPVVGLTDLATAGWFAALSDARLAAKVAKNDWLVQKLAEIHVTLASINGQREAPVALNRDATVAVSPTHTYNEDMSQAPRGVKLILLGQGGVAQLGEYNGDPFWIGWAALPRRAQG